MLRLEDLMPNTLLDGVEQGQAVQVIAINMVGTDACTLYYKVAGGPLRERILFRTDEENLAIATQDLPWTFSADGERFRLVAEATRIQLAHLFDPMMAVHTSNVEPLPHQISAVYETMLPRQPLRFVLADDPGAGKTIMAGLLIRELLMRADARRVLIVAPGGLVDQWREELHSKFGLYFKIFSHHMTDQSFSGNPFDEQDLLIARLDQISRNEDIQEKLKLSRWDIIIMDEAHKLSASFYGKKVNETKRFKLAKMLGQTTRHLLLMTATPHNGKDDDFQLFLSLLDADRFCGRPRKQESGDKENTQKVDVSDIMRRLVKENLYRFDGTRLFPERRAYTANYTLSQLEQELYDAVTFYVREEMGKAERLQGSHKGRVGFALTALQRRLASSPKAIWESLKRRKKRLQKHLLDAQYIHDAHDAEKQLQNVYISSKNFLNNDDFYDDDEFTAEELEHAEDEFIDQATAARTIVELEKEIDLLEELEKQALDVVQSGADRKWEELSSILQDNIHMRNAEGLQRKLIIFTEHRDTLEYLRERIADVLGNPDAVVCIHGAVRREDRLHIQELFRHDKGVRILLATDAAGEGVNLQTANLMVNYDLPWNPNRLEQRFGRIHRIGQREVCHLWNMVAANTREGEVFARLLEKLECARDSLGGQVFNVLGEMFSEVKLKDLLIEAIRYGDDPARREFLEQKVDNATDIANIEEIMRRNTLCDEVMPLESVFAIREEMEKAEAKKLQPHYIRSFFLAAFEILGGVVRRREQGRFEITRVPSKVQERGKHDRDPRHNNPVLGRYERICFEKEHIELATPNAPKASLIHPGHPLMRAVLSIIKEEYASTLTSGALLLDPNDMGQSPRLLCIIDHAVKSEIYADKEEIISRRLHFVELNTQGQTQSVGWAPYLDYLPLSEAESELIKPLLQGNVLSCLSNAPEAQAIAHAMQHLVPQHFEEVSHKRKTSISRIASAVRERLTKEINYQSNQLIKYQEALANGKDTRLTIDNTKRLIEEFTTRLEFRERELNAMQRVIPASPGLVGAALVLPQGLLNKLQGQDSPSWSQDADARKHVEMLAMQCVMKHEEVKGNKVTDVSAQKCGWDVTSQPPAIPAGQTGQGDIIPEPRHIEVKGRAKGQTTITVTKNEILTALNQGQKFWLAIVFVDGENTEGPHYIQQPFRTEPDWAAGSVNYEISDLLGTCDN